MFFVKGILLTNNIAVAIINEVDIYMMKINIIEANENLGSPVSFEFVSNAQELDAVHENYSFDGDIVVKGEFVATGRGYRVSGQISCTKSFVCDRCLEQSSQQQVHDFDEAYQKRGQGYAEDDQDVNYFDGEQVDISPMIRDVLLSDQPLNNICNADCRGLCLKCGANLNHGDCGCDRTVIDPRLAALQQLLIKK